MKKALISIMTLGVAMALLVSCQNPSFSGTSVDSSISGAVTTNANAHETAGALTPSVTSGAITAGATNTTELVKVQFTNGKVDSNTLAAVKFYNLSNAALTSTSDGSYVRTTAITPNATLSHLDYNPATNVSTAYFILDLSGAVSNPIEVSIDPTVLTANSSSKKIDLDLDKVQGEAGDDDFVSYVTVGGTAVAALGSSRLPRTSILAAIPGGTLVPGPGTITRTYGLLNLPVAPATANYDSTNYKSVFDAAFKIQKFNGTSWVDAPYTSTYSTATGVYEQTLSTLPSALGLEIYRTKTVFSSTFVSAKTYRGYVLKGDYDQSKTVAYGVDQPVAEPVSTYNNAGTDMVDIANGGVTVTSAFSGSGYNGIVTIQFTAIGAQGLGGTINASTVRLYDRVVKAYVPVSSMLVETTTTTNDTIRITLAPYYHQTGNALEVQISPSVLDLGATTATTDDLKLGNWQNTTIIPYGWRIKRTGTI